MLRLRGNGALPAVKRHAKKASLAARLADFPVVSGWSCRWRSRRTTTVRSWWSSTGGLAAAPQRGRTNAKRALRPASPVAGWRRYFVVVLDDVESAFFFLPLFVASLAVPEPLVADDWLVVALWFRFEVELTSVDC